MFGIFSASTKLGLDRDRIMLNKIRNFARQAKMKSASQNGAQAPLGVFFFFLSFCPETPCSHFHGCAEECCIVPPWTKASEGYLSYQQSVQKNATKLLLNFFSFLVISKSTHYDFG